MSILIKDMEMPKNCHNCPLGFGGGCYCGTSEDEYMCPDHGRAEWCPLIELPPHGRLIDADALKDIFFCTEVDGVKTHVATVLVNAIIDDAPTIIEAEVKT